MAMGINEMKEPQPESQKVLSIALHEGIGLLKIGMRPEQILASIKEMYAEERLSGDSDLPIQISEDLEIVKGVTILRYTNPSFFFMVQYQKGHAVEISVDRYSGEHRKIMLYDIDIFQTSAEQLITRLKEFSSCVYDTDDEQLSYTYEFNDIGIRLWREDVFHPKLFLDKDYMDMMKLVIDDMVRYLYFDMITVKM